MCDEDSGIDLSATLEDLSFPEVFSQWFYAAAATNGEPRC
ncbi:hypothetical protein HRUBRA_01564 [Pseudohaliea rubra DSM 19751]|uniref:Uncharacterized protein n=1 Tax=Pseudohaliea rubra DSM 19751 TaxID=1265313 RepID=A0A095VQT0_9GAMM|nr:hypothetical protein HRUBRA_01564 [Pseudohaliea rubra DSM 19751]